MIKEWKLARYNYVAELWSKMEKENFLQGVPEKTLSKAYYSGLEAAIGPSWGSSKILSFAFFIWAQKP